MDDTSEKPFETNSAPNEDVAADMSLQDRLTDLTARATALYAVKKYEEAAELYSEATEIQAEINGEMAVENADLLYSYGRCLFYVAQKTSTVLGGTAASAQLKGGDKKPSKKRKANGAPKINAPVSNVQSSASAPEVTETPAVADVIPEEDVKPEENKFSAVGTPFFQITGDENWDDSEEEEEGEQEGEDEGNEEEEEEEDDFNTAYEILDLARVLYLRKLDEEEESTLKDAEKGKYVASIDLSSSVKEVKTRIADIFDLQAEISLEGEKFSAAVTDLKSCLALKEELQPPESSILAECHYKLSLALEAASQIQQRDAEGNPVGDITIDWPLRNESVEQQEKAIECCKKRVTKETKDLEELSAGKDKDKAMAQIEDVQGMISEMEDRLTELRKPPVSVKAEAEKDLKSDLMGSVLGQMMGGSKEEQKQKLAEVMAGANDLSGMVVKKKKPKSALDTPEVASDAESTVSKGKRKVEFVDMPEDMTNGGSKKAKVEDGLEG